LGSSTTSATTHGATAATRLESAAGLAADAATTTVGASARVETLRWACAALLDLDLVTVDGVGVIGDGILISLGRLEIDESAALEGELVDANKYDFRRLPWHG
jgi:hypothetical protein